MKLLIIGHGRHGKDTVAEYLSAMFGLTFKSSSMHCAENVVYPALKDKYNYKSAEDCFNDRSNHRAEWYNLISDYCKDDLALIGREIFEASDIYCGLRNKREFHAIKNNGLVDYTIWVDRSDWLETEPKSSMSLEPWMADYVIDNNGTLEQLHRNIYELYTHLQGKE
jgi:hypothetical protein